MMQNLEGTHAKAPETERKLCRELEEFVGKRMGQPHYIMDKMWHMMHRNDTKTMNLNKDFEELLIMRNKQGGMIRPKQQDSGQEEEDSPCD